MFTGIVKATGKIVNVDNHGSGRQIHIDTSHKYDWKYDWQEGNSVSVNGICLTLTNIKQDVITCELSEETLAKTTAQNWVPSYLVNLEPALKLGDELGGHWVTGHIDATGKIAEIQQDKDELGARFTFTAPSELLKLVVDKGSITIDGVSLTVNQTSEKDLTVTIIPWTRKNTIFE
ncbi:MAG: riboflavin synthase, partial [Candidatus Portiera sp.]|nr:riboflavin synthase [Portiera sp.]